MATRSTSRRAADLPAAPRASNLLPSAARERRALVERIEQARIATNKWLRQQILQHDRADLLAREALGYQVLPHHLRIQQHMVRYRGRISLVLAWRGGGKTSAGTVVYLLLSILQNPDIKILLCSKSSEKAEQILSEAKAHMERNPKFRAIFGDLVGEKWHERAITVSTRTKIAKEPTISITGIDSAVTGGHYDLVLVDDLVDKEYARTRIQREKAHQWFYETLLPCVEKPNGQMVVIGTRYHIKDLYGHLQEHECADSTLIIPVLVGNDIDGWTSSWEEKYPVKDMLTLRTSMGTLLFDGQYQCNCDKMNGDIFNYDQIVEIPASEVPQDLPAYTAADLAVSLEKKNNCFAIVDIRYDKDRDLVYVVDFEQGRYPPAKQRARIKEHTHRHGSVKTGIEANAYQAAAAEDIKAEDPTVNVVKLFTSTDKTAHAWEMSGRFDTGKIVFVEGLASLIDQVVLFPRADSDDGFDALYNAVQTIKARVKKPREEFGLL